jgi:uncharacterized protein
MPTAAEPLRVVLDTNVLVSGLHFGGTPGQLIRLLLRGDLDWYISPFILNELRRVLSEKFGWEKDAVQQALDLLTDVAKVVDPPQNIRVIEEKVEDNRILECAVHAGAHFLISGDKRHLLPLGELMGVSIVTPAEFLDQLLKSPSP